MSRLAMFDVLRRPQFRRIFLAQSISTLGDNIAPIAITFAILGTGRSAVELGVVLAARVVPLAAFALIGGAWGDRLPRRPIMVASDLIRLSTQAGFAVLFLFPSPALAAMVVLQFLNGAATAFFRPASSGLVQEAIPTEERQPANALLSATNSLTSIIGPGIGATLIAFVGYPAAIGVDALSFGLSALCLIGVIVPPRDRAPRLGLIREIGEGIGEVVHRRWIGLSIIGFCVFQLLPLAAFNVLGPLVSQQSYNGATTWALIAGLAGIGSLLGDIVALRLRASRPLVAVHIVGITTAPLLLALALQAPLPVLIVSGILWGFSFSVSNTFWFTTLQHHVPPNLMSRVSSLDWMGSLVLRPVGLAIIPLVAGATGATPVLLFAGLFTLVFETALMLTPSIYRVRTNDSPEESAHAPVAP